MLGLLASDIDGTLTASFDRIPENVVDYFTKKNQEGWHIAFITGRSFYFVEPLLKSLKFPYFLALQNGALLLEMPARKIVLRNYVSLNSAAAFSKLCKNFALESLFLGGFELQDQIFVLNSTNECDQRNYIEKRAQKFNEKLIFIDSLTELSDQEFASLKCFTNRDAARIKNELVQKLSLYIPIIRDPFCEGYFVLQATHLEATKGHVVKYLAKKLAISKSEKIVVVGDDHNDVEMFTAADISLAMSSAPKEVQEKASFVTAKPSQEEGIIDGLEQVFSYIKNNRV